MPQIALVCLAVFAQQPAQPEQPAPPLDWKTLEAGHLTRHVQLTSPEQFVKAGEAYFSPDNQWIIFQAVASPKPGEEPAPFYAMYVGKLMRDAEGHVTGLEKVARVSPPDSANTCGWFCPTEPGRVIFGSTLVHPADDEKSGFQVQSRKYKWMFPEEMDVVTTVVDAIAFEHPQPGDLPAVHVGEPRPVFERPRYDAECSYDPTGRFILSSHVEEDKPGTVHDSTYRSDANIYIYDTKTRQQHAIVTATGYDGGPFFSPDGKSICYRSDRKGNDLLQLFVADLKFEKDADGTPIPVGVEHEYQITDNTFVNWCPYWHPSGRFMIYATNEVTPVTHANYEIFAVEVDLPRLRAGTPGTRMRHARVTQADHADVLPVFSNDGRYMMWCSQRGPHGVIDHAPSSQIWLAEWINGSPFDAPAKPAN